MKDPILIEAEISRLKAEVDELKKKIAALESRPVYVPVFPAYPPPPSPGTIFWHPGFPPSGPGDFPAP